MKLLTATAPHRCAALALSALLAACGGGSDLPPDSPKPTGAPLGDQLFADSDSYHPLDKLRADGSLMEGNEADFGPRNPAYTGSPATASRWAIDTSATPPEGLRLSYSFKIEGLKASSEAVQSLQRNLFIDAATGLITQSCSGFPVCYDNVTSADEDFLITTTAQVPDGASLVRSFVFRVRRNQ